MARTVSSRPLVVTGLLWLLTFFVARGVLESATLGTPWRLAAALLPLPFFAWFLILYIRAVRSADELARRVQGEALAIAYPMALVLLMTLALMERAVGLKFDDWSYMHVWVFLPLFYFVGLAVAGRRYQ